MFAKLTIGDHGASIGAIGEALLFYGRTNLVMGGGNLPRLVKEFGFDNIIRCLDMGALELTYERKRYSVLTATSVIRYHGFGVSEFSRTEDGREIRSIADDVEITMTRQFGNAVEIRRQAKVIADHMAARQEKYPIQDEALRDVQDKEYFFSSVKEVIMALVPGYSLPGDFHASATKTGKGIIFASNVDYTELNRIYHQKVSPKHSTIDEAYILSHILDARKELVLSAGTGSDLWLSPAVSAVARNKVNLCAARLDRARQEIDLFQKHEFEGKNIRDAINNRERSITELLTLLEDQETQRYKKWLASQPTNTSLLREYHRAIFGRHSWLNGTASKWLQVFAFSGLGMAADAAIGSAGLATVAATAVGAGVGVATGAGQEFVLAKLLEGWQPNQFIDTEMRRFLSS